MKDALYVIAAAVIFFVTMDAHSDETVGPANDARAAICREELQDLFYIVRMYQHEIPFVRMRQKAINSHGNGLDDEHFDKINKLIDEAEDAAHEDKLIDWLNAAWSKCMDVI